ncbi:uncharacterized protein [Prorops nasuta]|uniref:uncharacterized protein isoform X2 n=1 Tax=Prorops nasuta TaxID=863751 RepID=UPI0034CFC1B3
MAFYNLVGSWRLDRVTRPAAAFFFATTAARVTTGSPRITGTLGRSAGNSKKSSARIAGDNTAGETPSTNISSSSVESSRAFFARFAAESSGTSSCSPLISEDSTEPPAPPSWIGHTQTHLAISTREAGHQSCQLQRAFYMLQMWKKIHVDRFFDQASPGGLRPVAQAQVQPLRPTFQTQGIFAATREQCAQIGLPILEKSDHWRRVVAKYQKTDHAKGASRYFPYLTLIAQSSRHATEKTIVLCKLESPNSANFCLTNCQEFFYSIPSSDASFLSFAVTMGSWILLHCSRIINTC